MKAEHSGFLFCFFVPLYMVFYRQMLIVLWQLPEQHLRLAPNGENWTLLLVEDL
jgi:hypothetical protein